MDTHSNAVPDSALEAAAAAPSLLAPVSPLYWSVRRELWENRSLYIAPLTVAAIALFSFLVGTIRLPARMRGLAALDPVQQQTTLSMPFDMAASVIFLITYVVGAFYCLEALYGERRDRSILFWKSLPVSDRTTVLSKAAVPLVVLPLFIFVIVIATQLVMLLWGTLVVLLNGLSPVPLWTRVPLFRMTLVMIYGLVVHALWHAPLYAWLLMVSAWARRLPLLWAVLPPLLIGVFDHVVGTHQFGAFVRYRLMGTLELAFDFKARGGFAPAIEPVRFLTSPGLWSGLLVAALFIAAAVRLRRHRQPI